MPGSVDLTEISLHFALICAEDKHVSRLRFSDVYVRVYVYEGSGLMFVYCGV